VNAAKLWNIGRWTAQRIWDGCGHIPCDGALKSYLKSHERYADLSAQSSQRVLEELDEAFVSWYGHRGNGSENANPPGYRKHDDKHPWSTVTFKADGFKHDARNGYIRLSKGRNTKAHWSDFILCAYEADPKVEIENIRQVHAVYEYGEWRLHIVRRHEVEVPDAPGDRTAGIDLGICNIAAVSYGDESVLYPGGALKADEYYFAKKRAETDDGASREARRLDQKRTERRTHFLHTLSKEIVHGCVARNIGTIVVGDLSGIRSEENGDSKNWGETRDPRFARMGVRPVHDDAHVQGRSRRDRSRSGLRTRYVEVLFGLWNEGRQPARRTRVVRLWGVWPGRQCRCERCRKHPTEKYLRIPIRG